MGLETLHVLSDERHHGSYICAICTNLCGLDALVTTTCSHVFCRLCLSTWLGRSDRCPTCNQSVLFDGRKQSQPTMMIGYHSVHAAFLETSQPVAHRVLKRIRVKCPLRSKHSCPWTGDYGDLQEHLVSTTAHSMTKVGVVETVDDENDEDHEAMEVDEEDSSLLAQSFKEEANGRFASGNFAQARDLYGKGISVLNDVSRQLSEDERKLLSALYTNRAATHLQLKQFDSCSSDCSRALSIDPSYIKAYVRRSKSQLELGRFEDACRELEDGCAKNPKSKLLVKQLLSAQAIRDKMQQGQDMLGQKEYVSAKALFGSLLRETSAPRVVLAAASADVGLGLTDSSLRLSLQVLRQNPQNADGYLVRGQCLMLGADFDKALSALRESVRLDPDKAAAKGSLRECKRIKEAVETARTAFFYRKFENAVTGFTIAIETCNVLPTKAPLYSILYSERGEAHLRLKDYAAALKDSSRAIYAMDDCERAWLTKIKAYHGLGRHEEAKAELEDLMERWGSNSEAIRKAYEKADFEVRKVKRPDFYGLLGVSPIASLMEIKKQYKVKAMEYHPDRWSSKEFSDEQRQQAEEKFKQLGEGLEILSDDFKRQLYDEGYDEDAIRERVEAAQRAAHRSSGNYQHGRHH